MTAIALVLLLAQAPPTLDADAGFQGTVFPDAWARFSATISYEGEPREAELRITLRSFASEPVVYRRAVSLSRKSRMRLGYDLYLTGLEYVAEVELVLPGIPGPKPVSLPLAVSRQDHTRLLVAGVAPPMIGDSMAKNPPVALVRLQAERLPPTSLSLCAVESILIPEPVPLELAQEAALLDWVSRGGRLIFGAGRSTVLRQNPFWRDLCPLAAPVIANRTVTLKDGPLSIAGVEGRLLRGSGAFPLGADPLLIRSSFGAGEVVFLPVVLDQPELGRAVAAPALFAEMLSLPPPPKEELIPRGRGFFRKVDPWVVANGAAVSVQPTTEFLRRLVPVSHFFQLGPLSLGVLVVVAFIVLIGPVDYLRLRKSGRLKSGWRSFAAVLVLSSGLLLLWASLVSPHAARLVIVTLLDENRARSYAVLRPSRGDVYDVESPGPLTALGASRPFGAEVPEKLRPSVSLPSAARLPTPPGASRMMVTVRDLPSEGRILAADWASAERKSLTIRNNAAFAVKRCWVVSKDTVWPLFDLLPSQSYSAELRDPVPFAKWAPAQWDPGSAREDWWRPDSVWDRVGAARYGLILNFHEAFMRAWYPEHSRQILAERGVDCSPALERGEVFLIGSFDHNLADLRCAPEIRPEVCGWARVRIREAAK